MGKTTFANRYLPDEAKQLEFVNTDLIARGLAPYDPDSVAVEAGKIALRRFHMGNDHERQDGCELAEAGEGSWIRLKNVLSLGTQPRNHYPKDPATSGGRGP